MRCFTLAITTFSLATQAVNVVQSNDDGWAEINIRQFYDSLTKAGFESFISAPADNESGTGSSDALPSPVGDDGCEFASCLSGSPAYGSNASMPQFNVGHSPQQTQGHVLTELDNQQYVNSYPVTSMRYGIQNLSRTFFGEAPDIAVAGPNVGSNLGSTTKISGTVGAICEAVKEGIPGIAFSGKTGSQTAWNAPISGYEIVYANLSTIVTQALTSSEKPYLASNIWLNVNFPASTGSSCSSPGSFKFVLSRINSAGSGTASDVVTCKNSGRLPTETTVVGTSGCYVSISVGHADSKNDATSSEQAIVLNKLKSILSCLP